MLNIKKKLFGLLVVFGAASSYANMNVIVSIAPQQTFVNKIAGSLVDVSLMVKPGASPHNYEPKPLQMKAISKADLYFAIGIDFEEVWLSKFSAQNKQMTIVHTQNGINKIKKQKHSHNEHKDDQYNNHHDHHESLDPHIWTGLSNVRIMAKNIAKALIQKDPRNKKTYEKNLQQFLSEIDQLDQEILSLFEKVPKHTKFMVFHPAFGYFAKEYDLEQIAIEVDGKEPKPKTLANIIHVAKDEGIKTIITSPEFSSKSAKVLAKEINGSVVKLSPLAKDWSMNLLKLAKIISKDNIK